LGTVWGTSKMVETMRKVPSVEVSADDASALFCDGDGNVGGNGGGGGGRFAVVAAGAAGRFSALDAGADAEPGMSNGVSKKAHALRAQSSDALKNIFNFIIRLPGGVIQPVTSILSIMPRIVNSVTGRYVFVLQTGVVFRREYVDLQSYNHSVICAFVDK